MAGGIVTVKTGATNAAGKLGRERAEDIVANWRALLAVPRRRELPLGHLRATQAGWAAVPGTHGY